MAKIAKKKTPTTTERDVCLLAESGEFVHLPPFTVCKKKKKKNPDACLRNGTTLLLFFASSSSSSSSFSFNQVCMQSGLSLFSSLLCRGSLSLSLSPPVHKSRIQPAAPSHSPCSLSAQTSFSLSLCAVLCHAEREREREDDSLSRHIVRRSMSSPCCCCCCCLFDRRLCLWQGLLSAQLGRIQYILYICYYINLLRNKLSRRRL